MEFKRKMLNGQRFEINGMEFICLETHIALQTRVDGDESRHRSRRQLLHSTQHLNRGTT
jgi:hypothetical protein